MKRLKELSIPVIVAVSMASVTTTVLAAFGAINYASERKRQQAILEERLSTVTDQLSTGLMIPIWGIDRVQIGRILESAMNDPNIQQVRVHAADELFARRHDERGRVVSFSEANPGKDLLYKSKNISYAGENIGTVEVWVTQERVNQVLRESRKQYALLVLLIALTLVVGLYFLLWKTVLKPLRQVEQYAVAVSSGGDAKTVLTSAPFPSELEILRASIKKMVDLLERRIAEVRESKERAESADRVKSEFLDIAAHELKTPLTPLTVLLQMTRLQTKNGVPVSDDVWERMELQVRRLIALVKDLLDVGRLERGNFPINPERVELNQLAVRCVQEFRDQFSRRRIAFEAAPEPVELDADPIRIHEVLANLIDNALKYAPGESPIEVRIRSLPGKRVRVFVTDHGPGIPQEQRVALFTRFFRVNSDATKKHSGLGLGLYICRRILETHHGAIGVESEVGKGSTFWFELPTLREAVAVA